jgi:hypothetical protein
MSAIDRILASFEALTKLFTRRLPAAFVWRYSVEEVTETSFSGRRLSPLCPFDDMPNIPLMPGIAGAGIAPKVGSVALVAFLDGDPSLPRCVGWDQAVPTTITIDASDRLKLGPSVQDNVGALVEIAVPADDPSIGKAVHRVGDFGDGGTFIAGVTPITFIYTGADGKAWTATLVAGTGMAALPVSASFLPAVPPAVPSLSAGAVVTKATTGSGKVTSG